MCYVLLIVRTHKIQLLLLSKPKIMECLLPRVWLYSVIFCFSPFSVPLASSQLWIATVHFTPKLCLLLSSLLLCSFIFVFSCGVCSVSLYVIFWVIYLDVSVLQYLWEEASIGSSYSAMFPASLSFFLNLFCLM